MTTIIGFDVSSTCIGWSVLTIDNNIIKLSDYGFVQPEDIEDIIDKLAKTRNKIKAIIDKYKPDYIAVEDIVKFMQGKSSAQTITTLTMYNRMVCLLAYDYLNQSPNLYNVLTIRHGIKLTKVLPKKEDIPDLVAHHLGINFPYETSKRGKILSSNYDIADSIAVALYKSFLLIGKIKQKKVKSK